MKFLSILLIIIAIFNCYTIADKKIDVEVFCSPGCQGSSSRISIFEEKCTSFSNFQTCGYQLPYITATKMINSTSNYTVTVSTGCGIFNLMTEEANVGVCNNYQISGINFSILPGQPYDADPDTSDSTTIKSSSLFILSSFVLLLIYYLI